VRLCLLAAAECACVRALSRGRDLCWSLLLPQGFVSSFSLPTFLSRAVIAHTPLTWAKHRFSTPRSARRPEVRFFFFFWSKLLVFNACWGFLSAVRLHCVSIQRYIPFFVSRKEVFFSPASPITSPEVWKETAEKPSFVLYLKCKPVSSS